MLCPICLYELQVVEMKKSHIDELGKLHYTCPECGSSILKNAFAKPAKAFSFGGANESSSSRIKKFHGL